ncbi:hypothetical protein [Roseivivax sp. CAU 1761]
MSALLGDDYERVLEMAIIAPVFAFDGDGADYDFLREAGPGDGPVVMTFDDGYAIQAIETCDEPAVVLRDPEGQVAGFYYKFMAWIDPVHRGRGRGLGVEMVLAYADHFQDAAWAEDMPGASQGMGFSEAGYAIHEQARQVVWTRSLGDLPGMAV